jgi:hypothetical protein
MRFSAAEVSSFRQQVWLSINALLVASRAKKSKTEAGDSMFWLLGGCGPSEADTVLFGFIASALVCAAYTSLSSMTKCSRILLTGFSLVPRRLNG